MLADERRRAVDEAGRLREVDERAVLAHAAEQRVVVLGDEAEPFVVAVEQHALAGLGIDRDLVGNARGVEQARPHDRRARHEARLEQRLELLAVLGAGGARRETRIGGEIGHTERAAQRLPVRLRPPRSGSSLPASRTAGTARRCRSAPCRAGAAAPLRRRRATRRTRTSSRRRATTSRAPGLRRSRAGGTARRGTRPPRASRSRCRSCPKRR